MQELLVDLYLRLCGLFRFVMIGTSSSDDSEDDNVLKLVSGAWARISEESDWVEWSDGDLGLIDLRWQRFAVRISSSGPEDPSASVWRFGAFLRFGGLLLDIIGVLSEDSVELADRIMFFRVLGSFGLVIDMTEYEDSVREDNMMFDLVLGSFGVAIGRSESDDSDGEETMMFVLDLGSFGVAMGRSESDDSDGEDNMMFDLVLGNFGVAIGRSESDDSDGGDTMMIAVGDTGLAESNSRSEGSGEAERHSFCWTGVIVGFRSIGSLSRLLLRGYMFE